MSAGPAPCVLLPWDSEFFGRRIARIRAGALSLGEARRVLEWAAQEGVECVYGLLDAADAESIRSAEAAGFHMVDTRVTFARENVGDREANGGPHADVVGARPADLPALVAIARVSHTTTRFYRDPGFPDARCADLYARWIEHSVGGWADETLVLRGGDKALGYLSCHLEDDGWGRIGLFALAPEARGRGLDRRLLGAALRWFARAGVRSVRVSTQACNLRGLRSYERAGFLVKAVAHWYHLWPAPVPPGAER